MPEFKSNLNTKNIFRTSRDILFLPDVGISTDVVDCGRKKYFTRCGGEVVLETENERSPFWGLLSGLFACSTLRMERIERQESVAQGNSPKYIPLSLRRFSRWRIRQASLILTHPLRRRVRFWKQPSKSSSWVAPTLFLLTLQDWRKGPFVEVL